MTRRSHSPILLPLVLLSLSLPHLTTAGTNSPGDFNSTCIDSANLTDRQETVAYLDAYDSDSETGTVGRTSWTWIDNGVCDNSLLICSNFSDSQNNQLRIRGFNFASGRNDPVRIETTFMCENCSACVLQVEVVSNTILETMNFTCDGSAQTNVLTQNVEFDTVQYSVIFDSGVTGTQCVTIESYRIWQYEDCPAQVFQLANYPSTNPGIGPVDSTGCVENAESNGTARAGCSDMSVWEMAPDTTPCTCSAGYESNGDLTACEECGDRMIKPTAGSGSCTDCPNGRVPNAERTACVCPTGSTGPSCGECAENYYSMSGGCVQCPMGSIRPVDDDLASCMCTGNRVTESGSLTTDSDDCTMCATGYYRADVQKNPNQPCNLCNTSYFKMGDKCELCPAGSSRDINDAAEGVCTCNSNLVTSGGGSSTSDPNVACDNCPADMLIHEGDCVECPDFSGRQPTSLPDVCQCVQNAATPVNFATSTRDPDTGCTACVNGYSRPSANDPCQAITVTFSEQEYSVTESQTVNLTIEANPPPGENQDIPVTINLPSPLSALQPELTLTSSAPSSSFMVSGYDDSVGLQSPRYFTVSLSTNSNATLNVSDDDAVQAMFERTEYAVAEDAGTAQVCVVLNIEAMQNVTVRITGELILDSGAKSADDLGTLSMELTILSSNNRDCFTITVTDDDEVEDTDEQYRLTMTRVSPQDHRFTVDEDMSTQVIILDNDEKEPESDLLPLIIGVSVGGALLAVFLASICIVCLCFWSANVKRQGFYHTYEGSQAAPTMLRYSASLRSISSQSVVAAEGKRASAKENEFFV